MSMNLLAPLYVRPIDQRTGNVQSFAAFDWISREETPHVLDVSVRGPRLVQAILSSQADIVCVQELQLQRRRRSSSSNSNGSNGTITTDPIRENNHRAGTCTPSSSTWTVPSWMESVLREYSLHVPSDAQLDRIASRNVRVLRSDAAVTCAILYRRRHDGNGTEEDRYDDWIVRKHGMNDDDDKDTTTCVSLCLEKRYQQKEDGTTNVFTVQVSSVHLDATCEMKRVRQLTKCLQRYNDDDNHPPSQRPHAILIAGDMNTECYPGSCVNAFLIHDDEDDDNDDDDDDTEEQQRQRRQVERQREQCAASHRLAPGQRLTDEQWKGWIQSHTEVKHTVRDLCIDLQRLRTGNTRVGYDHEEQQTTMNTTTTTTTRTTDPTALTQPPITYEPKMVQWRLDHIFYTPVTLRPCAMWSTLEADPEARRTGLPNRHHGSDHLSIAAVFQIVIPPPSLTDSHRVSLQRQLRDLIAQHDQQLREQQTASDAELASLLSQLPPPDSTTERDCRLYHKEAKTKKSTKPQPSKEVQEHKKRHRAAVRDLKTQQATERFAFVEGLGNLERLVVEEQVGCPAYRWASLG